MNSVISVGNSPLNLTLPDAFLAARLSSEQTDALNPEQNPAAGLENKFLQNPASVAAALAKLERQSDELRALALICLHQTDSAIKADAVQAMRAAWLDGKLSLNTVPEAAAIAQQFTATIPGRPERPLLVAPLDVKRRAMNTVEGRAVLIHALAHIEFNAINLALDAIWRFPSMPENYYTSWLQVAQEEAYHFTMVAQHLQNLGFAYGDFPAHNSLWEMVERTQEDVLARMALVPRTMEARGLDATPAIRAKLAQAGDLTAAAILDIILRDEIGHVAIGNHWFAYLCQQRSLNPLTTYAQLATQYRAPKMRPPFNLEARSAAGFSREELQLLQNPQD